MAGSHNATTPYHTITLEGVGNVMGFWVGFSLGTCCMIWLGSPIHIILLLDSLYTYIMMYGVDLLWVWGWCCMILLVLVLVLGLPCLAAVQSAETLTWVWVWSVWDAPIITCSSIIHVRNQKPTPITIAIDSPNAAVLPLSYLVQISVSGWGRTHNTQSWYSTGLYQYNTGYYTVEGA